MPTLTPFQAVKIAEGVYKLENDSVSQVKDALGSEGLFSATDDGRFKGHSGIRQWKPLTGFGYVAMGVGPYEGDALIAIRGTAPVQDWLTDGNMAMTGSTIHSGFLGTWNSFAHEIDAFFKGRKVNTIHCIGIVSAVRLRQLRRGIVCSAGMGSQNSILLVRRALGSSRLLQNSPRRLARIASIALPMWPIP